MAWTPRPPHRVANGGGTAGTLGLRQHLRRQEAALIYELG